MLKEQGSWSLTERVLAVAGQANLFKPIKVIGNLQQMIYFVYDAFCLNWSAIEMGKEAYSPKEMSETYSLSEISELFDQLVLLLTQTINS